LSSILKALKKLETDQDQQDLVRSLSKTVRRGKRKPGKSRSFSAIVKVSGIIVISVVLAAGSLIGISRVIKKEAKTTVGNLAQKSSALQTEPVEEVNAEKTKERQISHSGPVISSKALLDKPPSRINPKAAALPPKNTVSKPEKSEVPEKSNPAPLSPKASSVSGYEENGIKIDRDSGLKLMAIAWSAIPADRIAVINGRIVREGEAIDGAFISRINENEVILQKKDELLKLIFRVQ
jgi:hypothetical protein